MTITVVICTYNRCDVLARALQSIAESSLPDSVRWEVLIVDNNSTDRTSNVATGFCQRYPRRFRYLFEPLQGLSRARNAGIREARGQIVAFVDDDVTVEPTWLRSLTSGLHEGEWAGAGGRVLPHWTCEPPSWLPLTEWFGKAPLVMFDLGLEAGPLTELPFGANMAFRKSMFEKYGGFNTDLGRCGTGMLGGEDTEFGLRLRAAGERLRYEPAAIVYHSVPVNRLQRRYFLAWWFDKGRSDVLASGIATDTGWHVAGIPVHLLRKLVMGAVQWMVAVEPSKRFSRKLAVWFLAGRIVESSRRSHSSGAPARSS